MTLLGVTEGKEFEAATHLRKADTGSVAGPRSEFRQSCEDFAGLKLYGYLEDIDLVVIGHFAKRRSLDVEFKFYPRDGDPFIPRSAAVKNFVLVIEAKSHDATGVKFDDMIPSVRYAAEAIPLGSRSVRSAHGGGSADGVGIRRRD